MHILGLVPCKHYHLNHFNPVKLIETMAQKEALHVVFFPLMAHGHMIPLFDAVRLFTARGVKATIITTPANAAVFSESDNINLEIIPFPSDKVGLPSGVENFEHVDAGDNTFYKLCEAIKLLESPLESVLERLQPRPICLVSDTFLHWTAGVAERLGIRRVVFHGSGHFRMAVVDSMRVVRSTSQLNEAADEEKRKKALKIFELAFEAEKKSYGAIMNSFEALEPHFAEHYRKVMGRKTWSIGPVSLYNRNIQDKAARGKKADIDEHECLRWLDSKPPNSVIYLCFGSITKMSNAQLQEIALGLESSGQNFIWVVKRPGDTKINEEWLPSGFEDRTRDKGIIINGWAPQVMILDHVATGGFVTHCGWNSTLEGISAGVTMVTWPIFAEQFINEKLITDVLRVGVSVGADQYWDWVVEGASVGKEALEVAVRRAMVGEEAEELRTRAKELKEMAWKAVQEGGSSYNELTDLVEELRSFASVDDEY